MSAHSTSCLCPAAHRRKFLAASVALGGAAFIGASGSALAAAMTKAERAKLGDDDILAVMKKGNRRFSRGQRQDHDYLAQQRATASGQYPLAVLLSCIDSRAPAETIMDLRIGDVFNNRIAGNVADTDVLGGMEFACKLSGAKLVLVMGHTSCGAIKGAIDNAELGNLTLLLAKIRPAVAATVFSGERTAKNDAFVDAVARRNVELAVAGIRKDSPVLAQMEAGGAIRIAGAMYDLKTGIIDFL
jgi:carbonic anhydrase